MIAELKITLLQQDLHWENKTANLQIWTDVISTINQPTDIIVLPEMFTTGFTMNAESLAEDMNGETVKWMLATAKEKQAVITGSIIISENNHFYNRLIWAQPDGKLFHYNKHHLFSLSKEDDTYQFGIEKLVIDYKGWKIRPIICYDLRFPIWCRQNYFDEMETPERKYLGEYDVLLVVASWPQKRSLAWQTLLQARAIENQSYVVGLNRVGNDGNGIYHEGESSVFNALGDKLLKCETEICAKTISLSKENLIQTRRIFPFWRDADSFEIQ